MSKVYLIRNASSEQYEKVLESELAEKFKSGMNVAVKLHMGEAKGMFSPELARRAVSVLNKLGCKPFLFDTPVKYSGPRHTKEGYEKLAPTHGFSKERIGCPVIVSDDYVVIKTEHMSVEVSKDLANSDAFLVLTHFKGHGCSGIGGAIKNLAMGCVSPKSKIDEHGLAVPVIHEEECTACGLCEEVCPSGAAKVKDKVEINNAQCWSCTNCVYNCPNNTLTSELTFDILLTEATSAVLKAMKDKPVYYVSDARNITENCDCFSNPGKPIAKDVGVFLSDDIVAIEMASTDTVINQEGKNVFKEVHHHDPYIQIKEAEKAGLGSGDYDLEGQ
ncbi:MAG TPA: DUF362 domain-containing protein [Candidatus Nanoarchaeia archaeon]|nr:DUF362 domain-containing protein [Candidatus Nanoarchaeia archaeon]